MSVNWPVTAGPAERDSLAATIESIHRSADLPALLRDRNECSTWRQRGVAANWLRTIGLDAAADRVFLSPELTWLYCNPKRNKLSIHKSSLILEQKLPAIFWEVD